MLRKEQNDLLCQTGPGTPMGQMFRRSWQPALLAEELPENECPPVRVKLLGGAWLGVAPLAAQEASRDVAFVEMVTGRVVAFASGTPTLLGPLDVIADRTRVDVLAN